MVPALELHFISSLKLCEMLKTGLAAAFFRAFDRHMLILFNCVLLYGCVKAPCIYVGKD